MRKLFAGTLALAVIFSLSMPVFAEPITGTGSSDVEEVKVAVVGGGSSTPTVYYVTVGWDSLTFTYTESSHTNLWQPEEHTYRTSGGGGDWSKTTADISVTNHSNVGIGVAMTFDGSGTTKTVNGVTATLTNHTFDLDTGVGRTFETADKNSTTVTVANTPNVSNGFTIGMVKIAISDQ